VVTFLIILLSLSLLANAYLLVVGIRLVRITVAQRGAINALTLYVNFLNKVPNTEGRQDKEQRIVN